MTAELPSGTAAALDLRFPIDATGGTSRCFDALIRGAIKGGWDPQFLRDETDRAAYQAGIQSVVAAHGGERRYVRPLDETAPWQLPDEWYKPAPYPELTPSALDEWDGTAPQTAILEAS